MAEIISPNGKPVTSIGNGSRVMLKGDDNSPIMTVCGVFADQGGNVVGLACGWFAPGVDEHGRIDSQCSKWNVIQLSAESLVSAPELKDANA